MRALSISLAAALLAVPAAALANPSVGRYVSVGKRDRGAGIGFAIGHGRLSGFNARRVRLDCEGRPPRRVNPPRLQGRLRIGADRRFAGRLGGGSARHAYKARVKGRLGEGTGVAVGSVNYRLALANGDRCTSDPRRISWKARNRDLLFASGFEQPVTVHSPEVKDGVWRFPITGADDGFDWETDLPGPGPHGFYPMIPASEPVAPYAATRVETVTGRDGAPTRAAYQEVTRDAQFFPNGRVRNQFPLHWPGDRGYVAYRIRLQPDLAELMPPEESSWRYLMEFRGSAGHETDYRIWLGLIRNPGEAIKWKVRGERMLPRRMVDWASRKTNPPVPIGRWFRLEVAWVLDRAHGRFRVTVNGKTIVDHRGRTRLSGLLDSEQIFKTYTGASSLAHGPAYQWIDDVELRRRPPYG